MGSNTKAAKQLRVENVNQLLRAIGSCGRRFFYSRTHDRFATMDVDARGKVWLVDDYTGKRIYTHYRYDWRGFSHGGTLRTLIRHLRDYVSHGVLVPSHSFGPWPSDCCGGDPWGYKDDMQQVRDCAVKLGIVKSAELAKSMPATKEDGKE